MVAVGSLLKKIMAENTREDGFAFIVGSPRSGTTILGEILDKHQHISQWYEPYFVWDRYFRAAPDDERTEADATPEISKWIYRNFSKFKKKKKCTVLIDKSPRNSLKIPFILKIFPGAKFIHILRDGRDATLSINKEWLRRQHIVQNPISKGRFNYGKAYQVLLQFISLQPFILDKLRALWFETHGHFINKKKHLHQLRWNGKIGWGPKFRNWEQIYAQSSLLQFNAYQWLHCVQRIETDWHLIPENDRLSVRYEDLIQTPRQVTTEILDFLGFKASNAFFESLPEIKADNYNKWKAAFSKKDLTEIGPILSTQLKKFGYTESEEWINGI
jgi:hypothetical protein